MISTRTRIYRFVTRTPARTRRIHVQAVLSMPCSPRCSCCVARAG
eukprot:COSAG01_NODE_20267_length_962_cov_2.472769_1_plen_44_part_10